MSVCAKVLSAPAPEDQSEIHVHQVAVMGFQEGDLCGDPDAPPQRLEVDLVRAANRVPPDDEAFVPGQVIEVDHRVAAGG